jgi:hypothetical protein
VECDLPPLRALQVPDEIFYVQLLQFGLRRNITHREKPALSSRGAEGIVREKKRAYNALKVVRSSRPQRETAAMKKLALNIEELTVETFYTAAGEDGRGTVLARGYGTTINPSACDGYAPCYQSDGGPFYSYCSWTCTEPSCYGSCRDETCGCTGPAGGDTYC